MGIAIRGVDHQGIHIVQVAGIDREGQGDGCSGRAVVKIVVEEVHGGENLVPVRITIEEQIGPGGGAVVEDHIVVDIPNGAVRRKSHPHATPIGTGDIAADGVVDEVGGGEALHSYAPATGAPGLGAGVTVNDVIGERHRGGIDAHPAASVGRIALKHIVTEGDGARGALTSRTAP